MLLGLLRSLLFALLMVVTILSGLQLLASPTEPSKVVGFAMFSMLLLVVGPLWPGSSNIDKWFRFSDRHSRVVTLFASGSLALAGIYIAWAGLTYADETRPRTKYMGLIYDVFGYQGIGFVWLCVGVATIVTSVLGLIVMFISTTRTASRGQ